MMINFRQLPRLISWRGVIDIEIGFIEEQLKSWKDRYEDGYGLDLDPDFQRGHVWSSLQKTKFIEFLIRGGKCPPLLFNSPAYGGSSTKGSDLSEKIVIVDGKQRLNAIIEFLHNKVQVFNGNVLSDFEDAEYLTRQVCVTYAVNTLKTRRELLQWYLELNEGHIAHSEEELDRVRSMIKDGT